MLIEIGRRLDNCVRVSDMIGRLGGDRFGVVLSHCPADGVGAAAEKILAEVERDADHRPPPVARSMPACRSAAPRFPIRG